METTQTESLKDKLQQFNLPWSFGLKVQNVDDISYTIVEETQKGLVLGEEPMGDSYQRNIVMVTPEGLFITHGLPEYSEHETFFYKLDEKDFEDITSRFGGETLPLFESKKELQSERPDLVQKYEERVSKLMDASQKDYWDIMERTIDPLSVVFSKPDIHGPDYYGLKFD